MIDTGTQHDAPASNGYPRAAIIWLVAAALVKFIAPALPLFNGHSLTQASGICNGVLGTLAQHFDHQAATTCATVNDLTMLVNVIAGVALVVAAVVGVRWLRARNQPTG